MSKPTPTLPAPLAQAVRRFEKWRKARTKREIPGTLWELATKLGAKYGVNRTATTLRLDYYDLKRRVKAADKEVSARDAQQTFVEVMPAAASGRTNACLIELEDTRGAKMRIHLESAGAAELATVGQLFWRQEG